jgi:hypothetical protein
MNGIELASQFWRERWVATPPRGTSCDAFDVRGSVGRLVELRVMDLSHPDDVAALSASIASVAAPAGARVLLFADYRSAAPFAQSIADAWSLAMRRSNTKVLRSAILLDPANETFNLQIARVIRCAGLATRRSFEEPAELRDWLGEVATPLERDRIDELLAASARRAGR